MRLNPLLFAAANAATITVWHTVSHVATNYYDTTTISTLPPTTVVQGAPSSSAPQPAGNPADNNQSADNSPAEQNTSPTSSSTQQPETPETSSSLAPTTLVTRSFSSSSAETPTTSTPTTSTPATSTPSTSSTPTTSSTSTSEPTTSSTSSSSTSAPTDGLDDFESEILSETNKKRALHSAPALTWNWTLAEYASNYAKKFDCDNVQLIHSGGPYGENLAAGYSGGKSPVDAWYDEINQYDWSNPGFSEATGHLTQLLWKTSTQMGCARIQCNNAWNQYTICEYSPRGNIVGQDTATTQKYFRANVLQH